MVRPTGFMFSMAKGKKSEEESPEFFDDAEVSACPKKLDRFMGCELNYAYVKRSTFFVPLPIKLLIFTDV